MNSIVLLIVLILLLGGAFHFSPTWGPYPASGLGLVLVVVLILFLLGKL